MYWSCFSPFNSGEYRVDNKKSLTALSREACLDRYVLVFVDTYCMIKMYMNFLAEGLKKYYIRQKSRIIFCGNMSLNALSLTLWQMLECSEIDPSVISRVLKGTRLFSPKQLQAFCKALSIQGVEKQDLFSRLSKDILLREGFESISMSIEHKHFVSFISRQFHTLEKIYAIDPSQGIEERSAFISLVLSLK